MSTPNEHDPHEHDPHEHDPHEHESESEFALRTKAIESLLVEKGLITSAVLDRVAHVFESDVGPLIGAKVVAHAWSTPEYKQRLLRDGRSALAELGIKMGQEFVVHENTCNTHNVIVCTLCSCYPWAVLGLPPNWYKSPAYRSRMVLEPREVLRELGLVLGEEIEIRVWDSSAETRYMVLPERPADTDDWSEEQLAAIVSREAMTGIARVEVPSTISTGAR